MAKERPSDIATELALYRATEFIEDGKKTIIKCSRCEAELVEIWIIRPKAKISTTITAECPHCGDKSFGVQIEGQYCIGNIESGKTVMIDTPTKTTNLGDRLVQTIVVKTEKG